MIKINADFLKKPRYKQKFRPLNHLGVHFDTYILQVDGKDNSGGRTYLFIKDKLPKFKQVDGIEISYPSIVELISMLSGKRLIYYNKFAEDHCNVEDTVNRHMQDDVFNLINEDEYFLYREFFCVQVFLQRISETDTAGHTVMTPSDVRNYDITSKLLAMLTEGCNSFYNDAIIIRYEMESERLQAQYFLSKFHCNREWNLDPVCVLNFRISSFILPGTFSSEKSI